MNMETWEEKRQYWEEWERRFDDLWKELDDDRKWYFENYAFAPVPQMSDIEEPYMQQLFDLAVKMHSITAERKEYADEMYRLEYAEIWELDKPQEERKENIS